MNEPSITPRNGNPIIGVVVGEASGDILGSGLIVELKKFYPDAQFVGIGGPKMIAEGFHSLYPQDRLAVMGLIEPLRRLPELLRIRKNLIQYFIEQKPLLVIGIDSPDFNLGLELAVKKAGITTAHYVSPSVWAWRQGRVKKIAKAVNLMLTLLPFEAEFYHQNNVPVKFIGHPLADDIPLENSQDEAIAALGLTAKSADETIVALMPGSRTMEVERLGSVFLQTAHLLNKRFQSIRFLIPSANAGRYQQLQELLTLHASDCRIELIEGRSCEVMQASDVVLMASGTTTLEALLIKRPMVIAYIVAPLSYRIFKWMVKVPFIGLPNLLAGRSIVPEYIQNAATPQALSDAIANWLTINSQKKAELISCFESIHRQLKNNASQTAAQALVELIEKKND